jgi:hypothetical protein
MYVDHVFHLLLSGLCPDLVGIHPGDESTSSDLKILVIGSYFILDLFLTGFHFNQCVFHYMFHVHNVAIKVCAAISNQISQSIQFHF